MSVTSFTRLASANAYDNALRNIQSRQTSLANLQESLTSGKKITSPSDDPTGAAQAERAMNRLARIATDQRALEAQRNSIQMAEGTLGDITNALQNFRELVVSAGNGANSASERKTIAGQLKGLREQILTLSNTLDSNGMPLFASLGSELKPFVGPQLTAPDYSFDGLPGQSPSSQYAIPFTLDGESAFMHQPSRDGVFNVSVTNTTSQLIPTDRALITDNIKITDNAIIGATAAYATTNSNVDYPDYQVQFSNVIQDPVTGRTSGQYLVVETPPTPATHSHPRTLNM